MAAILLKRQRKHVLKLLAAEFGLEVSDSALVKDIVEDILGASEYDEETGKAFLERILEELAEEKEKKTREFELEKLRITNNPPEVNNELSANALVNDGASRRVNLKDLVPKFDPKMIDITLFFMIFERQARKENIEENKWVSQLIPLLPADVAELIVKEPEELGDNYSHMKKMLLKRFRLSPLALRLKFEEHQRKPGALWSDLVYELRGYLENWLESAEVSDFTTLKELMLTEQLKRRVPPEMREHFIDRWEDLQQASELAKKLDHHERVRETFKKADGKPWERRQFEKGKKGYVQHKEKGEIQGKSGNGEKRETPQKDQKVNFEKRKEIICFGCKLPGHIRPLCPNSKKPREDLLCHLDNNNKIGDCFKPFLSEAKINNIKRQCLRDTGSGIDLCARSWVRNEDLTGEVVWVRQPLDNECKCLPLARVVIEGDFGTIITKAAVKADELDQGFYILGNKSAKLIEDCPKNPIPINAVLTRSQVRNKEAITQSAPAKQEEEETRPPLTIEEADKEFLPQNGMGEQSALARVSAESFLEEQRKCPSLKLLWERSGNSEDSEFEVKNGRLIRISASKRGEERVQLCIPLKFREQVMTFCHEQVVSGHLGTTKTKDRVLRYYFWPNCYKEIESYVRSCDSCQKVGKNRDKIKAPLKLVPIISEVFAKINIDAVGPLPVSSKNNRYLITSICLASKYPDAIPVENITSVSVINALLEMFCRIGFVREVQSDLGTSFTSVLTAEFFDKFGIKVTRSSVCHPQSNPVERWHSSLKRVLKVLCLETGKDWEQNLPFALFALRTVSHESTSFSPAELVYGKNLRTPQTIVYENWMGSESTDSNVVEYILDLINRLKKCQDLAGKKMVESQEKRKMWYDRNAVSRSFKVGDKVLVLATSKPNKMAVSWIGPGVVTSKISETNYLIDLPEKRDKTTIYHVNLMKPYYSRPENINLIMDENREDVENEAEIPYPLRESTLFDFHEIVRENNLQARATAEQIDSFVKMLRDHKKVFSADPGSTTLVEMDIELTSTDPVRARPYRMSPRQTGILREEITRLLDLGVIEVGQSDYSSPIILVESPGKDPRPCVDYRRLNAITRTEYFPLPNVEEVLEKVSAAPYITIMDLTKGYFQIPLSERAQRYATFVTNFGIYKPKKMMFGLVNSPYYFCKLMAQVLAGMETFVVPYMDDIAIFSPTWDAHILDVGRVLTRLQEANLTVKPSKCKFAQDHVKFLGHEVGSGKRSPSEVKIKAIQDFATPTTKTHIRSFLGVVSYYSRYIPNYSKTAAPLTDLLKGRIKKEKIVWTDECQEAFTELKGCLTRSPVLYAPDYTQEFIVQTDASGVGAGIVLSQIREGQEHPILYISKKFSKAERNYSVIERELAAIVFGLKKLNHYLDGQKFVIQTDHDPLKVLNKMVGTNARLTRWALCLQQYHYRIEPRPGKKNGNADGLSRLTD